MTTIICGVDVAADTLEAAIGRHGPTRRFERTADGIADLAAFCTAHQVELVALEATGGYEKMPFRRLWGHGLPAAILNPRAVRRFAEAMGVLEKTDRLDAGMIAWLAEVKRIVPQPPPGPAQERLAALVRRLGQLTALRTAQSNQRRLADEPSVMASFDELMALVNRQIRGLETAIAELIDSDPLWRRLDASFRSIKGVADRTVAHLMAELPEIGRLSNKAVAKLAGLAPLAQDSGKVSGRRPVRAGRSRVRAVLYVVAEIVRRHEPDFIAWHGKLSQAGKPKKLIRIALARKLLVRLNAKARDVRQQLALAS